MSLTDKMRCKNCGHPRYLHNGSHKKGRRTMCQRQVGESHLDKCTCLEFEEPDRAPANGGLLPGKKG